MICIIKRGTNRSAYNFSSKIFQIFWGILHNSYIDERMISLKRLIHFAELIWFGIYCLFSVLSRIVQMFSRTRSMENRNSCNSIVNCTMARKVRDKSILRIKIITLRQTFKYYSPFNRETIRCGYIDSLVVQLPWARYPVLIRPGVSDYLINGSFYPIPESAQVPPLCDAHYSLIERVKRESNSQRKILSSRDATRTRCKETAIHVLGW